jgi:hypothetical protein
MTWSPVTTTVRSQGAKIRQNCRGSATHHSCNVTPTGSVLSKAMRTGGAPGSTTALPPGAVALTARKVWLSTVMTPSARAVVVGGASAASATRPAARPRRGPRESPRIIRVTRPLLELSASPA